MVDKTRNLVAEQATQVTDPELFSREAELRERLNQSIAKVASLENELAKQKQSSLRNVNSNQYLDETNIRLRTKLEDLKADEQSLIQRNKELALENRKLQNSSKSWAQQDETSYAKLRNLELINSKLDRQLSNLKSENSKLKAEKMKFSQDVDRLMLENTGISQRLAATEIDFENTEKQLSMIEDQYNTTENKLLILESDEDVLRESLQAARNEVSRLNGEANILEDRLFMTEEELDEANGNIMQLELETDSLR